MATEDTGDVLKIDLPASAKKISLTDMGVTPQEPSHHLLPPDWEVDSSVVTALEQLIDSWEAPAASDEQRLAATLVKGATGTIEQWTPAPGKEKGYDAHAKIVRDAIAADRSDAEEVIWETTHAASLEGTRFKIGLLQRFNSLGRDVQRGMDSVHKTVKENIDVINPQEFAQISALCAIAYVQSDQRPQIQERAIHVLQSTGRRLGQNPPPPETYRAAFGLFDTAIAPIKKTVLYQANKALGPAPRQ